MRPDSTVTEDATMGFSLSKAEVHFSSVLFETVG